MPISICPFCGFENIQGADECGHCQENLSSLDAVVPNSKLEEVLMRDPISKMKPKRGVSVPEQGSILDALKKMEEIKSGCVLVENAQGKLTGIFTERDLLFRVIGNIKVLDRTPVSEVMTPSPETLQDNATLAYALHMMSVNRVRHIPVLSEGKPPGLISVRDVLNYLAKTLP